MPARLTGKLNARLLGINFFHFPRFRLFSFVFLPSPNIRFDFSDQTIFTTSSHEKFWDMICQLGQTHRVPILAQNTRASARMSLTTTPSFELSWGCTSEVEMTHAAVPFVHPLISSNFSDSSFSLEPSPEILTFILFSLYNTKCRDWGDEKRQAVQDNEIESFPRASTGRPSACTSISVQPFHQ